jgi:hypothetical protein
LSKEIQADSELFFCLFLFLKKPSGSGDGERLTMEGEAARPPPVPHRPNRNPARQGRTASRPCTERTPELRPRESGNGIPKSTHHVSENLAPAIFSKYGSGLLFGNLW